MTQHDTKPVARTPHAEIPLDVLGEIQPGLGRLMNEVSDRFWNLYYAAQASNWKLATLQCSELKKLLVIGAVTRPKYKDDLNDFTQGPMKAIDQAIENRDWPSFEKEYQKATHIANVYHEDWNHSEIVWQLPDEPPKHLRLTPPKP